MISVYCPQHGSDVLLGPRRILDLDNTGDQVTIRWLCWCGYVGCHRTGRRRILTAVR